MTFETSETICMLTGAAAVAVLCASAARHRGGVYTVAAPSECSARITDDAVSARAAAVEPAAAPPAGAADPFDALFGLDADAERHMQSHNVPKPPRNVKKMQQSLTEKLECRDGGRTVGARVLRGGVVADAPKPILTVGVPIATPIALDRECEGDAPSSSWRD